MKQLTRLLWSISFILICVGCSQVEEPALNQSGQKLNTRGASAITPVLTKSEAISIANNALNRTNDNSITSVSVITDTNEDYVGGFLSDTLAYVVKYGVDKGYAIVANDRRITTPLAYSAKGNFPDDPSILKYLVLDRIPKLMESLNNGELDYRLNANPTIRYIVEPQIDVPISIFPPFSNQIEKDFGSFNAGFGVVSSATLLSFFYDDYTFNHYSYGLKQMVYALKQGPGYDPIAPIGDFPGIVYPDPDLTISFINSYNGALAGYNQLLYDIGIATNTRYYIDGRAYTSPNMVKNFLSGQGFELSDEIEGYPYNSIVQYLTDGYIINLWFKCLHKDGSPVDVPVFEAPISILIDGCDVKLNEYGDIVDGSFRIVTGVDQEFDIYINPMIWLEDTNDEMEVISRYGVKAK